jgi:trimethylamine--corrinoid protein Co-methyltransferase
LARRDAKRGRDGGGRAARLAKRSAPPEEGERAVRPGHRGGRYKPLEDSDVERIWEAAFELLETVGMASPIPDFVDVVTKAGGRLTDDERLIFPRRLVERCMEMAAKRFTIFGFDPKYDLNIRGERVHFGTAGAAVLRLDLKERRFHPSTLVDLYDLARLYHNLDNIHFFLRPLVARDMETSRELDINTAYAVMMGSTKPVASSFFEPGHVREVARMCDMALGRSGAFKDRPFLHAANTFVVPPLRFAEESCQCLVEQVRANMPVMLVSAGQAGATSPAALAGALVQGLAECLSGLVVVNLLKPGHSAIMCLWPFVSDLRTGAMSGGSGEEALLNAAAAQVLNARNLPSGVSAGMTDSKLPDNQAGYEKGITVTLAAQAGANMIYESASMLASILGSSPEAFVIDDDMMSAINRTVRGIEVSEDTLSMDTIREVVRGEGHFLGHEQTLRLMQRDYVYPDVADRLSPKDWEDQGATDITERAGEKARRILTGYFPTHIGPQTDREIRERFPIRLPREEIEGPTGRW